MLGVVPKKVDFCVQCTAKIADFPISLLVPGGMILLNFRDERGCTFVNVKCISNL